MPFYVKLRYDIKDKVNRGRVIDKLLALRKRLDKKIPSKDAEDNLLLATWNLRDFDKVNRRGYGKRLPESFFYIAEIISRFDFVAVQEVNRLNEWQKVMAILGPNWDYIATDVTDPSLGGNGERMTFVFDKRKVWFQNIAGEIVLPNSMLVAKTQTTSRGKSITSGKQFRRSPFVASFQSGWFKFDICTVHIYYGTDSGPKLQERVDEIDRIANYLSNRADIGLKEDRALILLGDFNIKSPDHKTMEALLNYDFVVPKALRLKTNVKDTKYYDQIAFKTRKDVIEYIDNRSNAGVFDLFENCYRDEDKAHYHNEMRKTSAFKSTKYKKNFKKYYSDWRTYQISDHRPLWTRLKVNESEAYLQRLKK